MQVVPVGTVQSSPPSPCHASSSGKARLEALPASLEIFLPICCCCLPERSKLLPQPRSRLLASSAKTRVLGEHLCPKMQSWPTEHEGNLLPRKQIRKIRAAAVRMHSRSWRRAQPRFLLLGAVGVSKGRGCCRAGEREAHFYSPICCLYSLQRSEALLKALPNSFTPIRDTRAVSPASRLATAAGAEGCHWPSQSALSARYCCLATHAHGAQPTAWPLRDHRQPRC